MKREDKITFQGKQTTIGQLVINLGLLAVRGKLRHGIELVITVYTMYADYPSNEQVIVMAKVKTPNGFNLLELKTIDALGEFVSELEIGE